MVGLFHVLALNPPRQMVFVLVIEWALPWHLHPMAIAPKLLPPAQKRQRARSNAAERFFSFRFAPRNERSKIRKRLR